MFDTKSVKPCAQVLDAAPVLHVLGVDVGDDGDGGGQAVEGAVALVGLDHHPLALPHAGVGAVGVDDAAVDDRRVDAARVQQGRDHGGGGGLAVGSGDGDVGFQAHQLGQHLGAAHHRQAAARGRRRARGCRGLIAEEITTTSAPSRFSAGLADEDRRAQPLQPVGDRASPSGPSPGPGSRGSAAPRRCPTCRCRRCRRSGSGPSRSAAWWRRPSRRFRQFNSPAPDLLRPVLRPCRQGAPAARAARAPARRGHAAWRRRGAPGPAPSGRRGWRRRVCDSGMQDGGAGLDQRARIGGLVVAGGGGEGDQDRRAADHAEVGDGRRAGAADDELRLGDAVGHVVEEGASPRRRSRRGRRRSATRVRPRRGPDGRRGRCAQVLGQGGDSASGTHVGQDARALAAADDQERHRAVGAGGM